MLKVLKASIKRTASESSSLKTWLIAWMAASQPDSWLAHTCRFTTDLITSSLKEWTIALPIILLMTLPTPIGRSPGFLSKGICLLAKNTSKESVWSDSIGKFFAKLARANCRWNSGQNCWMWVFSFNHWHLHLKALIHLLYAEGYF